MKSPVESLRLTAEDRERLIRIKRITGIESWNVLCRWALMLGLRDGKSGTLAAHDGRGAVEIKWDTFAGSQGPILIHLIAWCHVCVAAEKRPSVSEFVHGALSHGILIMSKPGTIQNLSSFGKLLSR